MPSSPPPGEQFLDALEAGEAGPRQPTDSRRLRAVFSGIIQFQDWPRKSAGLTWEFPDARG